MRAPVLLLKARLWNAETGCSPTPSCDDAHFLCQAPGPRPVFDRGVCGRVQEGAVAGGTSFPGRAGGDARFARVLLGSERGDTLIEIVISVLLVALIVVATLNGFEPRQGSSADQRHHSQAALLAAQSQEQLRSDPASALDTLESAPHTSKDSRRDDLQDRPGSQTDQLRRTGHRLQVQRNDLPERRLYPDHLVGHLAAARHRQTPAVKQASLIAPPTGSDIEVDVSNGAATPAGGSPASRRPQVHPGGSRNASHDRRDHRVGGLRGTDRDPRHQRDDLNRRKSRFRHPQRDTESAAERTDNRPQYHDPLPRDLQRSREDHRRIHL